jgi:tryptophanyl-tRNA synthetase
MTQLGNLLGFFLPYLELQRTAPSTTPLFLSIVGMHSITLPQDPKKLVEDRRNMLAALLAAGVDPARTCLYFQEDVSLRRWARSTRSVAPRARSAISFLRSAAAYPRQRNASSSRNKENFETDTQVPEHAELAWYLNTLTPVGHLKRMTTWKSKLVVSRNANSEDEISEGDLKLGLLSYPVLQAADIMLYK